MSLQQSRSHRVGVVDDVISLDVLLPAGMSGFEVFDEVERRHEADQGTARDSRYDRVLSEVPVVLPPA